MNQLLLTVQREVPKDAAGWDWGFKLQTLYGSDGRYTLYVGVFNQAMTGRYQVTPLEACATVHMPVLTEHGIDVKAGMFVGPLGSEGIDAASNIFYSHSYIYTWGLPATNTGVLATWHVNPMLDIYAGFDSGSNTSLPPGGDNNSAWAGQFGLGLNLLDGNLTLLAISHIGPDNAALTPSQPLGVANANHYMRSYNDAFAVWKATSALTLTTEIDYTRDDLIGAEAFGVAQYAVYALNDKFALNMRGEVFRDGKGYFFGVFPGNNDFINYERGRSSGAIAWPNSPHATYGAVTLGATWKPALPASVGHLMLRPEIRYDTALAGPRPFNGGRDRGSFTFGTDAVLSY